LILWLLWVSDALPISVKGQISSRQKPSDNMHTFIKNRTTTLPAPVDAIYEGKNDD
jgi:hypothetical protein